MRIYSMSAGRQTDVNKKLRIRSLIRSCGFCIAMAALLAGCTEDMESQSHSFDETRQITFDEFASQHVQSCTLIPLETTRESVLGDIVKIETNGADLFIMHSLSGGEKKVARFGLADGTFKGEIGVKGRAQNEYTSICDMALDKAEGEVYLFCPYGRTLVYDYDGAHRRTIKTENETIEQLSSFVTSSLITPDGILLGLSPNFSTDISFCRIDRAFTDATVLGRLDKKTQYGSIAMRNAIAANGQGALLLHPATFLITAVAPGEEAGEYCLNDSMQEKLDAAFDQSEDWTAYYEHARADYSFLRTVFSTGRLQLAASYRELYCWQDNSVLYVVSGSDGSSAVYPASPHMIRYADKEQIIISTTKRDIENRLHSDITNDKLRQELQELNGQLSDDCNPVIARYILKQE